MQNTSFNKSVYLVIALLSGFIFLLFNQNAVAQSEDPYVYGRIIDERGQGLPNVSVRDANSPHQTVSDGDGNYTLRVMEGLTAVLQFRKPGYKNEDRTVRLRQGDIREINLNMDPVDYVVKENDLKKYTLKEAEVSSRKVIRASNVERLDVKAVEVMPTPMGSIEQALRIFGAQSNNELSNSYSVRGGNFDENLVYVNDFEIYRPFLIRSGQQEGLSFINPDLVRSISFSAGGFEAKYGDKMASVLDVKYKAPQRFAGSVSGGLLGYSAHIEGAGLRDTLTERPKLTYIFGYRHRTNTYLLNSLPTKGQYAPSASDFQGYVTWQFHPRWQWQLIGNYGRNMFNFVPVESQTSFGTFADALKINTYFYGNERDAYSTLMGGSALQFLSRNGRLSLKAMGSYYRTQEREAFNIVGVYFLGEVEKNLTDEDLGDIKRLLGIGAYQDWARNELKTNIFNVGHRGYYDFKPHFVSWGANGQWEHIRDGLNEWYRWDSAGYNIPLANDQIVFKERLQAAADIRSYRLSGFVQDEWAVLPDNVLTLNAGVRANYWSLNKEALISPRLQVAWHPRLFAPDSNKTVQNDLVLRLSLGSYHQPAFFRELRNMQGEVNIDLKAQKSYQIVVGGEYIFNMFNRPFKLTSEIYYKRFFDLVSFDYDNMLIRYAGQNNSQGYAAGIDTRLFGQFVDGVDSWVSLSVMKTRENLKNDFYYKFYNAEGQEIKLGTPTGNDPIADTLQVSIGDMPRPTDQRVNFSLFFQDYLPRNKNFKMHLLFTVGTGFPFGPPGLAQYRNAFRITPYRRIDIGFSALLLDSEKRDLPAKSIWRSFKSIWATLEIFNLPGIQNTVSYSWLKAISTDLGTEVVYGIPNYLTSRRINARLIVKF